MSRMSRKRPSLALKSGIAGDVIERLAADAGGQRESLPLNQIQERPGGDARKLRFAHVEALAESILLVGLIQPIVVDRQGYLLAGGHRLAALRLLQKQHPRQFERLFSTGIPVRRLEIDADAETAAALEIEITENEKRLDFSRGEVQAVAQRLLDAGYQRRRGKPSQGEKSLIPALMKVFGKSRSTIQRYLEPDSAELNRSNDTFSDRAQPEKQADSVVVSLILKAPRSQAEAVAQAYSQALQDAGIQVEQWSMESGSKGVATIRLQTQYPARPIHSAETTETHTHRT